MKPGTCYVDVIKFTEVHPDSIIVHGEVYSPFYNDYIGHAWIITDAGYVWEPQTGRFFPPSEFNKLARPVEHNRYTYEEALKHMVRTEHYGPWIPKQLEHHIDDRLPLTPLAKPFPAFMSPKYVGTHERVPRYFYHVPDGKVKFGKTIKAYRISEPEYADSFGKGHKNFKYVWLSQSVIYGYTDAYIIDITRLWNKDLRFTGQVEGHLLHKGDILPDAVVGIRKASGEIVTRSR